jgi:hypothetical protein
MKKVLALACLLTLSSVAHAFKGELSFTKSQANVEHSLKLSNWRVNKKGIPSFDYSYSQTGPGCEFRASGNIVAGFDEYDGKIELQIYNPEDERGRETGQVLLFNDDATNFTLPYKESRQAGSVGFGRTLTADEQKKSCQKKSDRLSVHFKRSR